MLGDFGLERRWKNTEFSPEQPSRHRHEPMQPNRGTDPQAGCRERRVVLSDDYVRIKAVGRDSAADEGDYDLPVWPNRFGQTDGRSYLDAREVIERKWQQDNLALSHGTDARHPGDKCLPAAPSGTRTRD